MDRWFVTPMPKRGLAPRLAVAAALLAAFVLGWQARGGLAPAVLLLAAQLRDWSTRRFELLLDGLGAHPYLTVALIAAIVWRRRIEALLDAVATAIPQREVKLDLKGVKLEFGAPDVSAVAGALPIVSRSPFELQPERAVGRGVVLHDLASGIQFDSSDYMGLRYAATERGRAACTSMRHVRAALETACAGGDASQIPTLVDMLARRLEACRFLEAERLVDLLERHDALRQYVEAAVARVEKETDPVRRTADAWVLLAFAVGYARERRWGAGRRTVENIVAGGKLPAATAPFLPAAATYVACLYNDFIDRTLLSPAQDLGTAQFFADFAPVRAEMELLGTRIAAASEADWQAFGTQAAGYHRREYLKIVGLVLTFLADETLDEARSRELLAAGTRCLEQCVESHFQEAPTGLDHNNLADAYRKQKRLDEALQRLEHISRDDRDPIFADTRARILVAQGRLWSALQALQEYRQDECRSADEVEYFLWNQVLAAQIAAKLPDQPEAYRLGLAIDILRPAAAYAEQHRAELAGSGAVDQLVAMLGAAYLSIAGHEAGAVDLLVRHAGIEPPPAATEPMGSAWGRQVTLARARVALSRRRRLDHGLIEADQERRAAQALLRDAGARLEALPFAQARSFRRRSRYFLLHVDTAVALQELAEECLLQGDGKSAQGLSDGPLAGIVQALAAGIESLPDLRQPFGAPDDFARQWRLLQARFHLLQGRLCAAPSTTGIDAPARAKAEAAFQKALGVERGLDAAVNMAWGDLLLAVALRGSDDPWTSYERSLGCFIASTRADDADWRALAHQRLAEAYAAGPTVRRRAPAARANTA